VKGRAAAALLEVLRFMADDLSGHYRDGAISRIDALAAALDEEAPAESPSESVPTDRPSEEGQA
jgi:hypothetical protein